MIYGIYRDGSGIKLTVYDISRIERPPKYLASRLQCAQVPAIGLPS